jgi:hypothetical protein
VVCAGTEEGRVQGREKRRGEGGISMTRYISYSVYPKFVCPECFSTGNSLSFDGYFIYPRKSMFTAVVDDNYFAVAAVETPFQKEIKSSRDAIGKPKEPEEPPEAETPEEPKLDWSEMPDLLGPLEELKEWLICTYCGRSKYIRPPFSYLSPDEIMIILISKAPVPWTCDNPIHDGQGEEVLGGSPLDDDVRRQIDSLQCCIKIKCKCGKKFLVDKGCI